MGLWSGLVKAAGIVGKPATIAGVLIFPFFGGIANANVNHQVASMVGPDLAGRAGASLAGETISEFNDVASLVDSSEVATSFWSLLFTDPLGQAEGLAGVGQAWMGIGNGCGFLAQSVFNVVADFVAPGSSLVLSPIFESASLLGQFKDIAEPVLVPG